MSVYKEGFYIAEELTKASRQIYPDAADYGVPVKPGSRLWNMAKQLADFYGKKETRTVERYLTGHSAEIEISLLDEWSGKGTEFRFILSYTTADKLKDGCVGYISLTPVGALAARTREAVYA